MPSTELLSCANPSLELQVECRLFPERLPAAIETTGGRIPRGRRRPFRDPVPSEHLDGNAGAIALGRALSRALLWSAGRGDGARSAEPAPVASGLSPERQHARLLQRRLSVYVARARYARECQAGGIPLALLAPSPLSGADSKTARGSPRGGFSHFRLSVSLSISVDLTAFCAAAPSGVRSEGS